MSPVVSLYNCPERKAVTYCQSEALGAELEAWIAAGMPQGEPEPPKKLYHSRWVKEYRGDECCLVLVTEEASP